ncbi:amiloride-sensitive sodium channel domain-containing protein [Ditylenchus destructor]|nr:amiloride-sensitive sodium channel domain-containing protein [Ditylenchus destructor]
MSENTEAVRFYASYPFLESSTQNEVAVQCNLMNRNRGNRCKRELTQLPYNDRLKWHFKQFCYKTSSHGIPWLGRAPNLPYRIVWMFLLCSCAIMFLYQVSNVIERYKRNDKITDIHLSYDTAPFPAITICSLNPYLDSLLKDVEAIKRIMNVYTTIILRAARTNELLAAEGEETPTEIETMKRVKRQLNTTFFEPAYSECNCSKPIREEDLECTAHKTTVPNKNLEEYEEGGIDERAMCLCAFDRESGDAWPCYPHQKWSERICGYCDTHSFCTLDEKPGSPFANRSCMCQSLDPFCVGLEKGAEIVKLWHYYGFFEEEKEIIETLGFQNMSDEITIVNKAKENLIYAMSELSEKQRIALSIPKSQLIQKCSFNGKACDIDKDFSIIADPTFGNCYTFNHNRNETKSSFRAGPANGLRLLLFVNASEYLPITESVGVRISIHDQDEFPFPDVFGYNAPTGFISSFGMKLSRMSRLPSPFGQCVKDGIGDKYIYRNYRYSTEGCYRSCFQEMVTKNCGCADPRFPTPPGVSHCEVFNSTSRKCLEEQTVQLGKMHKLVGSGSRCKCQQPCEQSIYTVSYSAANWPSYSLNMSNSDACDLGQDLCNEYFRENGAMVEIFYEALNYEVFVESEAYGLVKMMADFGGQLGLWSGVSFMTCVEYLFFFVELLFIIFNHHYEKRIMAQANKAKN